MDKQTVTPSPNRRVLAATSNANSASGGAATAWRRDLPPVLRASAAPATSAPLDEVQPWQGQFPARETLRIKLLTAARDAMASIVQEIQINRVLVLFTGQAMPKKETAFSSLSHALDSRLLRACGVLGFTHLTPVQEKVIPLALAGKDVLARSPTGTGKTLAYGLPLCSNILSAKANLARTDLAFRSTRALVLVPTRELAEQVSVHLSKLCTALGDDGLVTVANVSGSHLGKGKGKESNDKVQKQALADRPDVVVATPARALGYLRSGDLLLSNLQTLVIDEADLTLSYGVSAEDIRAILRGSWGLPSVYQSFLMSATLTGDVEELQGIVLRDPEIVMIDVQEDDLVNLLQYAVRCSETDKFLLLYVIFKLKLIRGKCLVFVNDTDRSYRVKLFLEKFGIKAGVLNAELPFNSRYHAVQEFNRGVIDYLIATDESGSVLDRNKDPESYLLAAEPSEAGPSTPKKRKRNERNTAASSGEYGVSRGIDFIDVSCVLNFDLPTNPKSYTHRIGRTARAGRSGTALSFVVPRAQWGKRDKGLGHGAEGVSLKGAKYDEETWEQIEVSQKDRGGVKDYVFDMKQVEGFRYRMEDALRAVTRSAVREARVKEIKNEVVNSEKLKAHFEDNPADLAFLKHDKPLHPSRILPHLKHIPSYLMPQIGAVGPSSSQDTPRVAFRKEMPRKKQKRAHKPLGGPGRRKEDPLKTFKSRKTS